MRELYKLEIAFILVGLISLFCYFTDTFVGTLFFFLSGISFLLMFVFVVVYRRTIGLMFGLVVGLTIGIDQLLDSEILKSRILLSATLDDDRAFLNLKLRENKRFELVSGYMFGEDVFKGRYKISNDKIIFIDRPYDNDFIPDTVYVYNDKIILRFGQDGQPITDYASFFQIQKDELNYKP